MGHGLPGTVEFWTNSIGELRFLGKNGKAKIELKL